MQSQMNPRDVYVRLLDIVDYFVQRAASLRVEDLQSFNPSLDELAATIRKLATVVRALASTSYEDEQIAINALQCCFEMQRLADVVREGNNEQLEEIFRRLEMYTRVP